MSTKNYQINAVKPLDFNSSSAIPQNHSGFSVSSGTPIPCQVNNSIKHSDFSSVSALPPNYGWTILSLISLKSLISLNSS